MEMFVINKQAFCFPLANCTTGNHDWFSIYKNIVVILLFKNIKLDL